MITPEQTQSIQRRPPANAAIQIPLTAIAYNLERSLSFRAA